LTVNVDAGVTIEQMVSVNHKIVRKDGAKNSCVVTLDAADRIPNKDFVLRWKVAGNKPKTALFVQKDKEGNGGISR
jgi:Ca-activated chloride channel family protein